MLALLIRPLTIFSLFIVTAACKFEDSASKKTPRSTMFIGVDVSGSFTRTKSFKDGMTFLGHYIKAHLDGEGILSKPQDLYVAGIGGNVKEDPQSFFPIHDFKGLSPEGIEKKLLKEFAGQADRLTDFNTFFNRIKTVVKQKNLVFAPLDIVLITDGVPEIAGKGANALKQAYSSIDLSPIEYLTRNITLRILYAGPRVGHNWRQHVPTKKVKIWTVGPEIMFGWRDQLQRAGNKGLEEWIFDNIDLRVRSRGL